MIFFFKSTSSWYAVETTEALSAEDRQKLVWLFGEAKPADQTEIPGEFVGPRKEMITPWSTNAVEITQNMGIIGITRIEEFTSWQFPVGSLQSTGGSDLTPDPSPQGEGSKSPLGDLGVSFDPMLQQRYTNLDQELFTINRKPDPVVELDDIAAYNTAEGLALSGEEVEYLESLSKKIGRKLTDSEVFGFSQVNSEHCRHKIFNGTFIIDGKEMTDSLFDLIRKTSNEHPNYLVSAYKDNVAFIAGPAIEQFAPGRQNVADYFVILDIDSVISLKAETHNFPTTVEPFNGAATGSGGEIRDRMAGGKGSIPMAGTAVYMTSYPRLEGGRSWEKAVKARKWLYKNPEDILIKASNGASDFGNKFGQPVICGSLLTFEHAEHGKTYGYDKVIMLAGGIGFARKEDSLKDIPEGGERIVILGGDNYRIGMGGGAVSSVATGEYGNAIELNAVQRSNPEMQKRVFNAIRAMAELGKNTIVSIHDHGAGGHLNSISELVEETGGTIRINALPIGDPTLSDREILSNESQERMGLLIRAEDLPLLKEIAERERAPLYDVGETRKDHELVFEDSRSGARPIDLNVDDFFGKPPKTIMRDTTVTASFSPVETGHAVQTGHALQTDAIQTDHNVQTGHAPSLREILDQLLQLEAVACKDWLTNKVDRAVSGKIAKQQTCGPIQLPLNNLGVTALDYQGEKGIATSLGHAPVVALANPAAGSRMSIAKALTNIVWAPLTHGLQGVSLSANWMWPAKNPGEDARLYEAVKAVSDFAIALGINIPTGKDSLSMTQKYPDGSVVYSPGTVIISAVAEVADVKKVISPNLEPDEETFLVYISFSDGGYHLGGSSLAQVLNKVGTEVPDITDPDYFRTLFDTLQNMISNGLILAGHDVSAGGLVTTLLEMVFPLEDWGMNLDLSGIGEPDPMKLLFSEKPAIVIQVKDMAAVTQQLVTAGSDLTPGPSPEGEGRKTPLGDLGVSGIWHHVIGRPLAGSTMNISLGSESLTLDVNELRDTWFKTSYLLDRHQCGPDLALERFSNFKKQPLTFHFPEKFSGLFSQYGIDPKRRKPSGVKGAIIREKGVNRDRDMAWAMYLSGFDVKDVHMTDLISGRETLEDVNFIAFVGGFSNSDVLGSAKGWAGAFLYNPKAKETLERFYARPDTLSLGVCNGCQLLVELGLIYPTHEAQPKMSWNDSHKYECTFVNVTIQENNSVMLESLTGSRLGIWVAHGEGKFNFPLPENRYQIPAKFSYSGYPGNPNGSMYDAAAICSEDGRHLAIMPHLEDSVLPWQWAYYPVDRKSDQVTPWIEAFVNAKNWIRDTRYGIRDGGPETA
ncbi:MAG: phosphoribosylformylglycinamidine synthase [Bacteroidales bacterium]|nr:phosphoribosylformylglycinamidine synthase [Bacteroidales bacterium]